MTARCWVQVAAVPEWAKMPDVHRVPFLNALTAQLWPWVERAATKLALGDNRLEDLLNSSTLRCWRPSWLANSGIRILGLSLGQAPPTVAGIKVGTRVAACWLWSPLDRLHGPCNLWSPLDRLHGEAPGQQCCTINITVILSGYAGVPALRVTPCRGCSCGGGGLCLGLPPRPPIGHPGAARPILEGDHAWADPGAADHGQHATGEHTAQPAIVVNLRACVACTQRGATDMVATDIVYDALACDRLLVHMQVGVSDLVVKGKCRITLKPLLDEVPVAGGVKVGRLALPAQLAVPIGLACAIVVLLGHH